MWAIILAAGASSRLMSVGVTTPKQFLENKGMPLFWHCAHVFSKVATVRGVVFVFPPAYIQGSPPLFLTHCNQQNPLRIPWRYTHGGECRQDSVYAALQVLPKECSHVLVHDAARPFVTAALIQRVAHTLHEGAQAVIPVVPVVDTIKEVDVNGVVHRTLQREVLRSVQTPQGFLRPMLEKAHKKAKELAWHVTDDASLLENMGEVVVVVEGAADNIKITTANDLRLLDGCVHKEREEFLPCTGFGYDVHRYGGDKPLILGGVPIACSVSVFAHSDGDTVLHALIDAILGCLCLGDIGTHFPDTSPEFAGISSGVLLAEVLELALREQLTILHVDITVIAEIPKIAPHRTAIAKSISKLLALAPHQVNVKATTEEGLGFTGEKKGMKAIAVVTGKRKQK